MGDLVSKELVLKHMDFLFKQYDFEINEPYCDTGMGCVVAILSRYLMIQFVEDRGGDGSVEIARFEPIMEWEQVEWFDSEYIQAYLEQLDPASAPRLTRTFRPYEDLSSKRKKKKSLEIKNEYILFVRNQVKREITPLSEYASFFRKSIDELFTLFSETQYPQTVQALDAVHYEITLKKHGKIWADRILGGVHGKRKIDQNRLALKRKGIDWWDIDRKDSPDERK
jgi:hypothetical protein